MKTVGGSWVRALCLGAVLWGGLAACGEKRDAAQGGEKPSSGAAADVQPAPAPPEITLPAPEPGAALEVVAARPQGRFWGALRPTLTFSKPVVPLATITQAGTPEAPATLTPALDGEWRWLGSTSVELIIKAPVPLGTEFTLKVNPKLKALDGSPLKDAPSYRFNSAPMEVAHISPLSGERWLTPTQEFRVTLNQPAQDFASKLSLTVDGTPVELELTSTTEEEHSEQERRTWPPGHAPSRSTDYRFKAKQPLPTAAKLELTVAAGLSPRDGAMPLKTDKVYRYQTHGATKILAVRACNPPEWDREGYQCPRGPLLLQTSNLVTIESLKTRVHIEPPVTIDWDRAAVREPRYWDDGTLPYVSLPAIYRPGTRYTVKVDAGVEGEVGGAAAAFEGHASLDDLPPYLDTGSSTALIESDGDAYLPLESVNIDSAVAEVWSVDPATFARMLGKECGWRDDDCRRPPGPPQIVRMDLSGDKNLVHWRPLDLRRPECFGEDEKNALFIARIRSPQLPKQRPSWIRGQLTDLAVHAKLGPVSGLAWVTRLSTGEAVPQARVQVFDRLGRARWSGQTNAEGIVEIPGLEDLVERKNRWGTPFALVTAETDSDTGVILSSWTSGLYPDAFDLPSDWEDERPRISGTLFTERGIYRSGETVHFKGVVRYRSLGKLRKPFAGTRAQIKIHDPRGNPHSMRARVSAFGTLHGSFDIPEDAPLGAWSVNAEMEVSGRTLQLDESFRVEAYRAPQFKVDVSTPSAHVIAGDALEASVNARYLFGGAMAGASVSWSVGRRSSHYSPPGNAGFDFGVHTWWWDDDAPDESSDIFASGEGQSDEAGVVAIAAGEAEAAGGRSYAYSIEAEVTDVNRQRVANRSRVTVHPAGLYAGLRRAGTGFAEVGKASPIEVVATTPEGERRSGAKLVVEVERREWKSIRKKGVSGEWYTMSEPEEVEVTRCELTSERSPVRCELTPEKPGMHTVRATVTDEKGREQTSRVSFYVVGGGWVSWQRNDTDRIDLVPDLQRYGVGDIARILVKSPWPKAEAVLTVEREGVLSHRRYSLEGSAAALDVPITEEMVPNVYVGVVLFRGRVPADAPAAVESGADPGRPAVRVGYTELKIEKRSRRLDVAVSPDAGVKGPGDPLTIALQVKDHEAQPARAELTVWAVDEGVLRLTNYEPPDPVALIYKRRGLSTRIAEPLLHLVLRRHYGDKGEESGGGGGQASGAAIRRNFKTTALFTPEVVTDADGRATVTVTLPDNLTTYRIMALAVGDDHRFGVGRSEIQVQKPLMALPALPRVARVGDRFEAGVVVHGPQLPEGSEITVSAEAEGLKLDGPAERKMTLVPGRPAEIRFPFNVQAQGSGRLRFQVSGAGHGDGVEKTLPLKLPVAMEAVAAYGDTKDKREEGIVPPAGVRPDVGGLELSLASTALGGFDAGMRQLVEYPYGCLEQRASRLVPFVVMREINETFALPWDATLANAWIPEELGGAGAKPSAEAVVELNIREILKQQRHDGSFSYWPGGHCGSPWGSSYAVLALDRARRAGYAVDIQSLARGKSYLADKVAAGECTRCWGRCTKPSDVTRIFALYTLARTGTPKASYYGELFERRPELPLFARAMLADAMLTGGGDRKQGDKLLRELLNYAKASPSELHFEEPKDPRLAAYWSSDARTTALVLQTLARTKPDHPYVTQMTTWLMKNRRRDGSFRNTQEAAFTLLALSDVVEHKEREKPAFEATVTLGAEAIAQQMFKGRSLKVERFTRDMQSLALGGQQPVPLIFGKSGPGVLYYSARLRYAPAQMPTEALERGITVQRWLEPYTGGGKITKVSAGELLRVKVRVASHMQRNYVVVNVPIPAGLEIVDTSLASTAQLGTLPGSDGPEDSYERDDAIDENGDPWSSGFYSPFNHTEKRDDRLLLFADTLPAGVHSSTFTLRATTPGDFQLPPAQAEEMYTPEVFGRSDGGRFAVVDPAGMSAR